LPTRGSKRKRIASLADDSGKLLQAKLSKLDEELKENDLE